MKGGDQPAVVQEWVRLAGQEPNTQRRADCAGLALVLADWIGRGNVWRAALEGFNVEQIEIVRRWKDAARREGLQEGRREGVQEGLQEARREDLRKVLRSRFPVELPEDLAQAIQQVEDVAVLSRWFDLALAASSLEEFRAAVGATLPPPDHNGAGKP